MALQGIDISAYQDGLDLNNISYDFVAIKVSEGTGYVNPACDKHYQEAKTQGKKRAVYHYANGGGAVDEANFFVDNAAGYIGDAIFVLDWEGEGVEYTDWALRFLKQVELRIGYKPAIYMSEYVVNNYDWSAVVANDNGLWAAKYSDYEIDNNYDMSGAGQMPDVKYWPFYFMWQWTSKGHLTGYAGDLDCNIAYLTPEQWDAYAGYKAPVEVPVAVPVETPTEPTNTETTPVTTPETTTPETTTTTTTVPVETPVTTTVGDTTSTAVPHPKVIAAVIYAALFNLVLEVLKHYSGITLDPAVQGYLTTLFAGAGGYLTSSK